MTTSLKIPRPPNVFGRYHPHVYFDEKTKEPKRELYQTAAKLLGVAMGRVHEKLIGAHPHRGANSRSIRHSSIS